MEHIHRIVYINLDHRTDRREEIERECRQLRVPEKKLIRFSAIKHVHGAVGCSCSHIAVLKRARDEEWPNVMILEDDTLNAQTTSGYVVHSCFYDALLDNFEKGLAQLKKAPHKHGQFALDMYWKRLQPSAQWFHAAPAIGTQRTSYSDIEKKLVNYGV